jgi:hypothetical protein
MDVILLSRARVLPECVYGVVAYRWEYMSKYITLREKTMKQRKQLPCTVEARKYVTREDMKKHMYHDKVVFPNNSSLTKNKNIYENN